MKVRELMVSDAKSCNMFTTLNSAAQIMGITIADSSL